MAAIEKHYSAKEIAKLWHLSAQKVRQLFRNEPGVIKLGTQAARHEGRHITLRIPESIAIRVHEKLRSGR